MQCSQTLSVISSTDWEKNHWSDETSPAFWVWARFAGTFSFCKIQLALDTVYRWYSSSSLRYTRPFLPLILSYLLFCSLIQGTPISAHLLFSPTLGFVAWSKVHRSKFFEARYTHTRITFGFLQPSVLFSEVRFTGFIQTLVLSYLLFCSLKQGYQFHSSSIVLSYILFCSLK